MANRSEEDGRKMAQQSLDRMLETIGPYLPKRRFGSSPAPSDWKIAEESTLLPQTQVAQPVQSK